MRRFKPIYKICYQSKKFFPIQFDPFKLSHRKWTYLKKTFIKSIRFRSGRLKNRYLFYKTRRQKLTSSFFLPYQLPTHRIITAFKLPEKKKDFFRERLHIRQHLKFFYGDITQKELKKLIKLFYKKRKYFENFFCFLETRLDIILLRSYMSQSIFQIHQFINHQYIYVNRKKVFSKSLLIKPGDVISFRYLQFITVKKVPAYLEVNFSLKYMLLLRYPTIKEIYHPFPCHSEFFLNSVLLKV